MKRFNIDEFLWFIILSGFTIYFYYLLSTGKISMFISPRMTKYMVFSLIGFGVLTIYQFTKIFTIRSRKPVNKSYLLLLMTLVIGYIAAQNGLNSNIADKKGVNITATDKKVASAANTTNNKVFKNIQYDPEKASKKLDAGGTIELKAENYYEQLVDIEDNIDKYKGRKLIITGFVFKNESIKNDEFVVSRLFMSCCAADSQVIGLMGKWKSSGTLKKDEWVKVEGNIDSTMYKDKQSGKETNVPVLIVDKVEKIQKPTDPYIYPY